MTHYLEIAGTVVGLLYLYLEYKASIWLWLAGIVMPAIYVFVYYDAGFYADMGINIYYLVAGVYGWVAWMTRRGTDGTALPVRRTPRRFILPLAALSGLFFAVIAAILINFTDSDVPYGDSFTTALSIVGLWLLARKYLEQWIVWIAVDAVCAGLYFYKELYPTAALYLLYTVIAVAGYYKWKKMMTDETLSDAR
ncbi:MAG: nicotinamide mononucleotide transporter [Rikenellaceae bacterium]|nr:nicotinamide mononucleotide transporter [Rikenellaceae bacterium]